MNFTINQLAIASFIIIAQEDGNLEQAEFDAYWETVEQFSVTVFSPNVDDFNLINTLINSGVMNWESVVSLVEEESQFTKMVMCFILHQAISNTRGLAKDHEFRISVLSKFIEEINLTVEKYNEFNNSFN